MRSGNAKRLRRYGARRSRDWNLRSNVLLNGIRKNSARHMSCTREIYAADVTPLSTNTKAKLESKGHVYKPRKKKHSTVRENVPAPNCTSNMKGWKINLLTSANDGRKTCFKRIQGSN